MGLDLTVGQTFVLIAYATLVSLATFWYSSPLGEKDPTRSGLIAIAQVPLVVTLGVKNSVCSCSWEGRGGNERRADFFPSSMPFGFWVYQVVSALLGKGSEKFNYLHRFLGRSIFVASTLHVAPYREFQSRRFESAVIREFRELNLLLLFTSSQVRYGG